MAASSASARSARAAATTRWPPTAYDVPRASASRSASPALLVPLFPQGLLRRAPVGADLRAGRLADEETRAGSDGVAAALRARGIPCEVAPAAEKFGKQIRYAERRGIPYVWFPGRRCRRRAGDEVKDIRSGDQVAADPRPGSRPTDDLHPTVTHA